MMKKDFVKMICLAFLMENVIRNYKFVIVLKDGEEIFAILKIKNDVNEKTAF